MAVHLRDNADYGATRQLLSTSLLSHFVPVVAPPMEHEQMRHIVYSKLREATTSVHSQP